MTGSGPSGRRWLLFAVLGVLVAAAVAFHVASGETPLPLPPALTRDEVRAMAAAQQAPAVVNELRRRLQAAGPTSGAWRRWPEAQRHVLVWSWVEGAEPMSTSPFRGFAVLAANAANRLPEPADVAAAAEALGATACAEAANAASDQPFTAAMATERTRERLHRYVRDHLDDLFASP